MLGNKLQISTTMSLSNANDAHDNLSEDDIDWQEALRTLKAHNDNIRDSEEEEEGFYETHINGRNSDGQDESDLLSTILCSISTAKDDFNFKKEIELEYYKGELESEDDLERAEKLAKYVESLESFDSDYPGLNNFDEIEGN